MSDSLDVRLVEQRSGGAGSSPRHARRPRWGLRKGARRVNILGNLQTHRNRGQECLLRLPGMCEKTVKVWIAGKPAMIVESSLDGVRVRIPDGLVTFENAEEHGAVGISATVEDPSQQDQPQHPQATIPSEDLSLGMGLHAQVSSERWCVTLEDLKEIRGKVKDALALGLIHPTSRDPFDPADRVVGPNIHTVTEQFIKRVTAQKGGMSWALMKHSNGLECDLFITHCWDEGIFEFLDKVIASWPRGARNAYCCMFSNPQNLNIGALIGSPKDSPFAMALKKATKMMVVPNGKKSIYTRLWCAYEAYTAYEEKKFIFTARAPLFSRSLRATATVAACGGLGVVYGWDGGYPLRTAWASPFAMALLTLVAQRSSLRKFVFCCMGARDAVRMATACIFVSNQDRLNIGLAPIVEIEEIIAGGNFNKIDPGWRETKDLAAIAILYALLAAYFLICAADHVSANVYKEGAAQLEAGYLGSVEHATCSRQVDEDAIWGEMANKKEKVDKAVRVLIDAGMSTERLRGAYENGVEVNEVAYIQWAPTVLALIWTTPFLFTEKTKEWNGDVAVLTRVTAFCDLSSSALIVLLVLWRQSLDQRPPAIACLQKLHLLLPVVAGVLFVVQKASAKFSLEDMFLAMVATGVIIKLVCAYLMKLDLDEIAGRFGRRFAQALLTYGYGDYRVYVNQAHQVLNEDVRVEASTRRHIENSGQDDDGGDDRGREWAGLIASISEDPALRCMDSASDMPAP